ncbi:MAG: RrF2 family transcriptional regulator [Acidobacteriota bacterium]
MHFPAKGEYALRAVFDLAAHDDGTPVRAADIAKRQRIPAKFLELILSALRQGGLVESRRGADGGYLLVRRPDAITVAEVLRIIEGEQRSRHADGPFAETWKRVDAAVDEIVGKTHFAQLVRDWKQRQQHYVPNWDI